MPRFFLYGEEFFFLAVRKIFLLQEKNLEAGKKTGARKNLFRPSIKKFFLGITNNFCGRLKVTTVFGDIDAEMRKEKVFSCYRLRCSELLNLF